MDCDRVFARLTAAPFPSGSPADHAVELHLLACPSCRSIAEALRPATADTPEALSAAERRQLPRYAGVESPAAAYSSAGATWTITGEAEPERSGPASRFDSSEWPSALNQQVASFALAPRSRTSGMWDALSLTALMLAVAAGGWGLGLLAM